MKIVPRIMAIELTRETSYVRLPKSTFDHLLKHSKSDSCLENHFVSLIARVGGIIVSAESVSIVIILRCPMRF